VGGREGDSGGKGKLVAGGGGVGGGEWKKGTKISTSCVWEMGETECEKMW